MLNLRKCSKIVLSEIVHFVKVSIIVITVHLRISSLSVVSYSFSSGWGVPWMEVQPRFRDPEIVSLQYQCPKGVVQLYCFHVSFFFIQVSSWSVWGSCSAPPGSCSTNSGTRNRGRILTSYPSCGGSSCPILTQKSQCTPVPIPCKVILIICCLFVKCFLYICHNL